MRFLSILTSLSLTSLAAFACTENADIAQDRPIQATGGSSQESTSRGGATQTSPGVGGATQTSPGVGGATTGGAPAAGGVAGQASEDDLRADIEPITTPDISDSEYAAFIADANAFGLDLTQRVEVTNALTSKNAVFSPVSAQIALAMAYAGAAGETATAMATTLHDTVGPAKYHAGSNRLLRDLASRNGQVSPRSSSQPLRIELSPANSLWVERTLSIKTPFLNTLGQHYDSGLRRVNFVDQPEPSRIAINQWVADHTHDRITDLLNSGDVGSLTRLVLVNALYLYANWDELFRVETTSPEVFHSLAGPEVQANMMHANRNLEYKATDAVEVVRLPYATGNLWMTLVLPKAGQFEAVRASVTGQSLAELSAGLAPTDVNLALPKFKIATDQLDLNAALSQLGMQAAFGNAANFTGITDSPLFISKVVQKAFIGVDEKGTEAAAATAVMMSGSAIITPIPLAFDRPFLYFVQDKTGLVLFAGHVVDPTM
ncbi:MAG TPA: serpin family protein [Polyangiaceae bacterium]|nr:serpin family protein [Polyangiaceae bacterium]